MMREVQRIMSRRHSSRVTNGWSPEGDSLSLVWTVESLVQYSLFGTFGQLTLAHGYRDLHLSSEELTVPATLRRIVRTIAADTSDTVRVIVDTEVYIPPSGGVVTYSVRYQLVD